MPELKTIARAWVDDLVREAARESSIGMIEEAPAMPSKFGEMLGRMLRESYAQGWWLNHLYVRELAAVYAGRKYRGRITLSDTPTDDELHDLLEDYMNGKDFDGWDAVIPQSAVDWVKGYVPVLAGSLSASVLEKVRDVVSASLQSGSTLQERMKALRESSPELSKMTDARIESIARTEITRADTLGRLSSMKSNDDVIGVEFSAVMDDRTTDICSSRHGLIMSLDDPRLAENTPPLHVRCRSVLLSLTVYDYPDGVLTSHEFDEVVAGNQRPEDIAEVLKIWNNNMPD